MSAHTGENIPIQEAARIMKKTEQFIRVCLQRGLLPFGTATKLSSQWTYYISPKLFYEYTGYKRPDAPGAPNEKEVVQA